MHGYKLQYICLALRKKQSMKNSSTKLKVDSDSNSESRMNSKSLCSSSETAIKKTQLNMLKMLNSYKEERAEVVGVTQKFIPDGPCEFNKSGIPIAERISSSEIAQLRMTKEINEYKISEILE